MGRPRKKPLPEDSDPIDSATDPDDVEALRESLTSDSPPPPVDPNEFHDAVDVEFNLAEGESRRELHHEYEQRERDTAEVLRGLRELDQGNAVKWAITRVGSSNPEDDGFIDSWPSSLMTLERLRDKFGAGTYYLAARRNGKYAGHKTITIAGDAPRRMNPTQPSSGQFNPTEFFAQQQALDRQRRDEETERRRYEEEREEKRDRRRLELLAVVAPAAATTLAALFGGNRGPDIASLAAAMKGPDPLLLLSGLKNLMPEPAPVIPQPDAIDKAISIMEKIDVLKGNPNGETNWMDIAKELVRAVGPQAGQVINAVVQRAQAVRAAQGAGTSPAIENGQAQLPPPVQEMPPQFVPAPGADMNLIQAAKLIPWLKGEVEKFLPAAAKRRDPSVYAALLLEELPEDQDPLALEQFVTRPDWFQWLQQLDPRVGNHPQWFAQMRAHLIEFLKEEAQAQEPQEPPAPSPPPRPAPIAPGPVRAPQSPEPENPVEVPAAGPLDPVSLLRGGV